MTGESGTLIMFSPQASGICNSSHAGNPSPDRDMEVWYKIWKRYVRCSVNSEEKSLKEIESASEFLHKQHIDSLCVA